MPSKGVRERCSSHSSAQEPFISRTTPTSPLPAPSATISGMPSHAPACPVGASDRTRASRIAPGLAIRLMSSAQYFSSTAGSWYDAWSRIAAPAGNDTRTCRKPPAAGNTPA